MPYGTEQPITKRGRIMIAIVLWAFVAIPFFVALAFMMGLWSLVLLIPAIWATRDYLRRGDFFGSVDQAFRAESRVADGLFDRERKRR